MEALTRLITCLIIVAVFAIGYIAIMRAGKGGE